MSLQREYGIETIAYTRTLTKMPIKALRALASRYAHGQVGWKPRPVGGELHFQPAIINSMM